MTEELNKDFNWHRALEIPGEDGEMIRKDYVGAIIRWDEYWMDSQHGWTIFPLLPYSKGGGDNLMSLLTFHIKNTVSKGEDYLIYETVISSVGVNTIPAIHK